MGNTFTPPPMITRNTSSSSLVSAELWKGRISRAQEHMMIKRERWGSRVAFLFASLGVAVGFGNLWRFPTLAVYRNARRYEYGGGAFLIPYFLALVLIGIPILTMEISLGQHHLAGDIGVFGKINSRFRGIGISSSLNSFIVVCYYAVLIGWTTRCLVSAFVNPSSWSTTEGDEAFSHFINTIVGMKSLEDGGYRPTRLILYNVLCLAFVWGIIFLGTAFGLEWTGKVTYVTMGVPLFLMVVLLIRAVTLEGAGDGIHAYIGGWELHVLYHQPGVWSTAASQVFFSLGITFGMFTAFGSHCPRNAPAFENSIMIALCNSFFCIVSGFSIFAALGYLAHKQGVTMDEIVVGGPALIFGAYPDVLETLPGGIMWVRLFFLDMFLLGIDCTFAIVEAIISVLKDMPYFRDVRTLKVSAFVCVMGFVCGLMYATDSGLFFMDVVDFYVDFVMMLIGMMECIAVGWFFNIERQFKRLGRRPVMIYMTTSFLSTFVASLCWFGISDVVISVSSGFALLVSIYAAGLVYAIRTSRLANKRRSSDVSTENDANGTTLDESEQTVQNKGQTQQYSDMEIAKELMLRNMLELKAELEPSVNFFPLWVAVLVKHLCPHALWILFVNLAVAKGSDGQVLLGNYGGYPTWPFQILGLSVFGTCICIVSLGFLSPATFERFASSTFKHDPGSPIGREINMEMTESPDSYQLMSADKEDGGRESKPDDTMT